jgi:hypothetical protein
MRFSVSAMCLVDERVEAAARREEAGAHQPVVGAPAGDDAPAGELEPGAIVVELGGEALLLGLGAGDLPLQLGLLRGRRVARGA